MTTETRLYRNQVLRKLLYELDLHDPGQEQHADRVAVYAVATGDAMGLAGEALEHLRNAALLHDVGKVKIDQKLLQKLGKLTDEEFAEMRLHAELAVRVIQTYDWLCPALPLIRHHHEWWNGNGYPDGLVGEHIPLGSRIIGACEAYDAIVMASPDTRRSEQAAIDELVRCAGTQFDAQVVTAFARIRHLVQPLEI